MITTVIALFWLAIFCWQFGVRARRKKGPAPVFLAPQTDLSAIQDPSAYNRGVFWLWILYGAVFAAAGVLCINRYDLLQRLTISAGAALGGLLLFLIAYRVLVRRFRSPGE